MVKTSRTCASSRARIAAASAACSLGLLLMGRDAARADDPVRWTGEQSNGLWSDGKNWNFLDVPIETDEVAIASGPVRMDIQGKAREINLDAALSIGNFGALVKNELVVGTAAGTGGGITQTGAAGLVEIQFRLTLGKARGDGVLPWASGTYSLSGGTLDASCVSIGDFGFGQFTQSGGVCKPGILGLGVRREQIEGTIYAGSGGYDLSGANEGELVQLLPSTLIVGWGGVGVLTQAGKTLVSVDAGKGTLTLGKDAGSDGSYTLGANGQAACGLRANEEIIGGWGSGSFTHTGGLNQVGTVTIAQGAGSHGSYNMSGGTLDVDSIVANGDFAQSGGTTAIQTEVQVVGGSYTLGGGTLTATKFTLSMGAAQQTGGWASFGTLDLAGAANFNLRGGFLACGKIVGAGNGVIIWQGGNLQIGRFLAPTIVAWSGANAEITAGGEIEFAPDGPYTVQGGAFTNSGNMVLSSSQTMDATGGTAFTNNAGATIDLEADASVSSSDATGVINNFGGTLTKSSGTGTSTIGVILNNSGTVSAASGTLDLVGGGTHTGTFTASNGATLAFSAGTHTFAGGTVAPDMYSAVAFSGATCTFDATTFQPGEGSTVTFSGGSSTLTNALLQPTSTGGIAFTGGAHTLGDGTVLNAPAGGSIILSGGTVTLAGTVYNTGTLTVDGAQLAGTGTLANSGTLTGQSIAVTCSTLTINNSGTFRFSSYSPSHFDGTLNNTGTVAAPGGVLALAGGGTHTGTFSGYVSFTGGTHTFNSGYAFAPGAHIGFAGADIVVNADWYAQPMVDPVTISLESGSVSGPGSLNLNEGTFNWTGGTLGSAVSVCRVAMYAGTINISGESKSLSGALTNSGTASTINWSGGDITLADGASEEILRKSPECAGWVPTNRDIQHVERRARAA